MLVEMGAKGVKLNSNRKNESNIKNSVCFSVFNSLSPTLTDKY